MHLRPVQRRRKLQDDPPHALMLSSDTPLIQPNKLQPLTAAMVETVPAAALTVAEAVVVTIDHDIPCNTVLNSPSSAYICSSLSNVKI